MYSSIAKKKCKCGCDKWPTLGYGGYFSEHAPEEIKERVGGRQKVVARNRNKRISDAAKLRTEQAKIDIPNGTFQLQRWFEDRHREMSGVCQHCGGNTEKGKSTFRCSVAHIFPKAHFKSVATHPDNWIELCFYGKSCHTNLDNYALDISELNCFDEVIRKVVAIYPSIAVAERRRIPQVLLNYIEVEK